MRLLQLAVGVDQMIDLHPNVSIVTDLDSDGRDLLVDAVTRLVRSEAVDAPGLLEAHGVMFDLDADLLRVIGANGHELDPVVRAEQLPSRPLSSEARELRTLEYRLSGLLETIAEQDERRVALHDAKDAAAAAVERLRAARAEAEDIRRDRQRHTEELAARKGSMVDERQRIDEGLEEAAPALTTAQAALAEVEQRTSTVRGAVEEARSLRMSIETELGELEPVSQAEAQHETAVARESLQAVEAAIDSERAEDAQRERERAEAAAAAEAEAAAAGVELVPAAERLERLDERSQELEQLLVVLTPIRHVAIQKARAALAGGDTLSLVKSPEAALLADELDRVEAELATSSPSDAEGRGDVSPADARERLDDARQTLLEAERALRSFNPDPEQVAALESVHAELMEAIERSASRFSPGAKRAAAQVIELRTSEEAILDALGFASYSAYVMGYSIASNDPQLTQTLHAARAELAEAEAEWRVVEAATERALARAELLDERRRLLDEARRMLGRATPDGLPQHDLRQLRVPAVPVEESARVLRDLLEVVGLDLGDEDVSNEELLLLADAWLAEVDQIDDRRRQALEEQAALRAERVEVLAQVEIEASLAASSVDGPDEPSEADRETARVARLAAARASLAQAEQRLAIATDAEVTRVALTVDLAEAKEIEHAAVEAAREAEHEISVARAAESECRERVQALEEARDRCAAELAQVEEAVRHLDEPLPDPAELAADLEAAEAQERSVVVDLEEVESTLVTVRDERDTLTAECERLSGLVAAETVTDATPAEELEWYLLARLASQRSVSIAGSAPLLLDDTLCGIETDDVGYLLDRLERMADAVQVIVISDDPVVASWATGAGPARAAVIRPESR